MKKCIRLFLVIFWILVIGATFSTQIVTCFSRDEVNSIRKLCIIYILKIQPIVIISDV